MLYKVVFQSAVYPVVIYFAELLINPDHWFIIKDLL